jgi:hypothetical protein
MQSPHTFATRTALNAAVEATVDVFIDYSPRPRLDGQEQANIYNSTWKSMGKKVGGADVEAQTAFVHPAFLQAQVAAGLAEHACKPGTLSGAAAAPPGVGGTVTLALVDGAKQHHGLFGDMNGVTHIQVSAYHSSSVHGMKASGQAEAPTNQTSIKSAKNAMAVAEAASVGVFGGGRVWVERIEATVGGGGGGLDFTTFVLGGISAINESISSNGLTVDGQISTSVLKEHMELSIEAGRYELPIAIHCHSFIHSFIHSSIHSFIHPFSCPFIHPFICPFIHPSVHSFRL